MARGMEANGEDGACDPTGELGVRGRGKEEEEGEGGRASSHFLTPHHQRAGARAAASKPRPPSPAVLPKLRSKAAANTQSLSVRG